MSGSSVLVLSAALTFLLAAVLAVVEHKPPALCFAYFFLFLANFAFSQLD